LKSGIDPVSLILGTVTDWVVDAFVKIVEVRWIGEVEVHHIPKLAIERYMYFAGLVNDNVGVTFC